MQIARRLYVYFIAAVSLAVLAVGLSNLLGLALTRLWEAAGWITVIQRSSDEVRRQLSLYTALVAVALPIWLLHWWLAERAVAGSSPEAAEERRSDVRAVYLTLALAAPFVVWTVFTVMLVSRALVNLFGPSGFATASTSVPTRLATVLVVTLLWLYQLWILRRDRTHISEPMHGIPLWLPRLYRYGATFTGAILVAVGLSNLLQLMLDVLLGPRALQVESRWWASPLANGIALALVGLVVWVVHWSLSTAIVGRSGWLGASERQSAIRRFYLYLAIFVGVLMSLTSVSGGLGELLRWALGAPEGFGELSLSRRILDPLLTAIPFAGVWLVHRVLLASEAERVEESGRRTSIRRLYTYLIAVVGLALAGVGLAYDLGVVLDVILGGNRTLSASSGSLRGAIAEFSAVALVGAPVWLWHWGRAERWVAERPAIERAATTRRVYLYLVLAVTVLAILSSLAVVIYRVLSILLGVGSSAGLISDLSTALGIVVVAAALLAYHATVLRRDLEVLSAAEQRAATMRLTLTGPPDADLTAVVADVRARLPEGFQLSVGK